MRKEIVEAFFEKRVGYGDKIVGSKKNELDIYKVHFRTYYRREDHPLQGFEPTRTGCTLDLDALIDFIKVLDKMYLICAKVTDEKMRDFITYCASELLGSKDANPSSTSVETLKRLFDQAKLRDHFGLLRSQFRHEKTHQMMSTPDFVKYHGEHVLTIMLINVLQAKSVQIQEQLGIHSTQLATAE